MNAPYQPDPEFEQRLFRKLLDVFIRAGLIFAMTALCYRIFSPFVSLMVWALILAVTLYPAHQKLARRMGDRQGWAATLLVLLGIVLIGAPTALLTSSVAESLQAFIASARGGTVTIPAPAPGVAQWPLIGPKAFGLWSQAHANLPATLRTMQPQIAELARTALGVAASMASGLLLFLASFIVAGIIMAFGQAGARSVRAIFVRVIGLERGEGFARLSTDTIRAVALGVLGVAFIQATVVGLVMIVAKVPFAGVLALAVLVLGIAQVPAFLVILPVIIYLWASGAYGTGAAIAYSVLLAIGGLLDNVLKPLLLGRGVDAPMPVILLGALGGLASTGIMGMFVGAVLLALGYQLFMGWVATSPDLPTVVPEPTTRR